MLRQQVVMFRYIYNAKNGMCSYVDTSTLPTYEFPEYSVALSVNYNARSKSSSVRGYRNKSENKLVEK
jgi:hypothetical protein